MDRETAREALLKFCSMPLESGASVLREFAALPGAISHFDGGKKNFVCLPGKREDRVLLVAHADTVWDSDYMGAYGEAVRQELLFSDGVYYGARKECGIGADDRAGCAMLWCLKDTGHTLLILDGEENGQIGAHHIRERYPALFDELNRHCYAIQLDRREDGNYKVYDLPVTREFIGFVEGSTGYKNAGRLSRTDIVVLCRDICGVNLSIGYYDEHTSDERLVFDEWFRTLQITEGMIKGRQKRYLLKK